eukprot:2835924-Prymnesium_polylepis.1
MRHRGRCRAGGRRPAGEHRAERLRHTTSSTAERSYSTSLVTPATGPATSTTISNVQLELRGGGRTL